MTTPAIRLDGVSRRFRRTDALADVSLDVPEGIVCGLLGRNGAGKTTLMSIIAGHDRPTRGRVEVFGRDPFEHGPTMNAMSFIRDNQRYPDDYKLRNALRIAPRFHPRWNDELAQQLVDAFRLPAKTDVRKYSRGQLSSLGIVIGLASRAPITIFDEPYLGLDATARQLFYRHLVTELAEHPRTVILSTHLIDEMESLLEHVIVVDQGRIVRDSSVDDARAAAFTLSGPAPSVESLLGDIRPLASHRLGGLLSVTVDGALTPGMSAAARTAGVQVSPASLQDLVSAYGSERAELEGASR